MVAVFASPSLTGLPAMNRAVHQANMVKALLLPEGKELKEGQSIEVNYSLIMETAIIAIIGFTNEDIPK